jgi:hypothetical protein
MTLTDATGNLIRSAWSNFDSEFKQTLQKIKAAQKLIEVEAFAANVESSQSRHEELKTILTQGFSTPRVTIKLPCRSILFQRQPRFFGREVDLTLLEHHLIHDHGSHQKSLAIVGLGGVGKTQLAVEFVWKHADEFEAVLWLQADSPQKIEQGFVQFARKLGLSDQTDTQEDSQIARKAVDWFSLTGEIIANDASLPHGS